MHPMLTRSVLVAVLALSGCSVCKPAVNCHNSVRYSLPSSAAVRAGVTVFARACVDGDCKEGDVSQGTPAANGLLIVVDDTTFEYRPVETIRAGAVPVSLLLRSAAGVELVNDQRNATFLANQAPDECTSSCGKTHISL